MSDAEMREVVTMALGDVEMALSANRRWAWLDSNRRLESAKRHLLDALRELASRTASPSANEGQTALPGVPVA